MEWVSLEGTTRAEKGWSDSYGPLPGEEICLECPLLRCVGELGIGCPLRAARAAWREELGAQVEAAIAGGGVFEVECASARWKHSVVKVARRMAPAGVRLTGEMGRRGCRFVLRVRVLEAEHGR